MKVIHSYHDGYCTGGENEEEILEERKYFRYRLEKKEHSQLELLTKNKIFFDTLNEEFIGTITPKTMISKQINVVYDGFLGDCKKSLHGLRHETQYTPVRFLGFVRRENNIDSLARMRKYYRENYEDPTNLQNYLSQMIFINPLIIKFVEIFNLPNDVIKIIYKFLWFKY